MKNLNFGRSGGTDKMEYIFGGALALIILAAIVLMTMHFIGGGSQGGVTIPDEFHMYCAECKKEYVIPKAKMMELAKQATPGPFRPKCPTCQKNALVREAVCPACGAYYITEAMITGQDSMMPVPTAGEQKCPKCGVDIRQYNRDHYKPN